MGSSTSTNLLLCWQDFHSIRALLAVSRAGCNHDSVVIFTMNQWRFRIIFLLSCLFSAYTFFLLHLFARWLDETLYWVWGCIPGSLMIKLSVSGCCLGRAFARYSATTELEKVCNNILLRPQKKKSEAERRTQILRKVPLWILISLCMFTWLLTDSQDEELGLLWSKLNLEVSTTKHSLPSELDPQKRVDFIQNHWTIIMDHTHKVPLGRRHFLIVLSGPYFRLINWTLKLQGNRTAARPCSSRQFAPKAWTYLPQKS